MPSSMQAACLLRYHMRWRNRHYLNNFAETRWHLSSGSPSNVQPHLYGENGDEPDADPGVIF